MSDGIVIGVVRATNKTHVMLCDGTWYSGGAGSPSLEEGDMVCLQYKTKTVRYGGGWKTFHNISATAVFDSRDAYKKAADKLDELYVEAIYPLTYYGET